MKLASAAGSRRLWTTRGCATALGALAFIPSSVKAQSDRSPSDEVESFVLTYDAPEPCPARENFEELAQALTAAAQFTDVGAQVEGELDEAPRRLRITIAERQRDYFGTFELVDEETSSRRQFDAATCEEIVEALALATALAIDPNALGAPAPEESPIAEGSPKEETAPPAEEPLAPVANHHIILGARGDLAWLQASRPGAEQSLEENRSTMLALVGSAYLEWEVRASGVWMSAEAAVGYGQSRPAAVDLDWLPSARLGLCPVWWEMSETFRVAPCLGSSFGRLRSTPEDGVRGAQTATRSWLSFDAALRLQAIFGGARVGVGAGVVTPAAELQYLLADAEGDDEALLVVNRRAAPQLSLNVGWAIF